MPAKNTIKLYLENGYYHLYNRGVDKRNIFQEGQDYKVFLHFLKRYLEAPVAGPNEVRPPWRSDLHREIRLLAFCLMPNHFHFLLKQFDRKAIAEFMKCLSNAYVKYFNEKYERVGTLFQGRYRGVLVKNDSQLLHLSRYIHLNPVELIEKKRGQNSLVDFQYSSYGDYLGKRNSDWLYTGDIMAFFRSAKKRDLRDLFSYQSFVEDYGKDPKENIRDLVLE